ncbi:DUF4177 domain-containing protein [Roseovarius aquimarinus]|uniref:DUF4177 domain-containing protein n=1 Tax=Roseovarius aquimarinus TaxID=1229156 RepID=A0ABW7I2G8_9RHOB
MAQYEYKVIPAPTKGVKAPGRKTPEARFAGTIESTLNAEAAEGWEYLRTDILPSDERQGLTGSQTVYRTLLVFRRAKDGAPTTAEDVIQSAQDAAEDARPAPETQPAAETPRREPSVTKIAPSHADPAPAPDAPETPDAPDTPDAPGAPDHGKPKPE